MNKIQIVAHTVDGIYKDSSKAKELIENRLIQSPDRISNWWYLHGKLENEVGYDKGIIVSMDYLKGRLIIENNKIKRTIYYLPDGIYDIEVVDIDKPCKGYFWTKFSEFSNIKGSVPYMYGLVVFADDKEANKYAYEKYVTKSTIL